MALPTLVKVALALVPRAVMAVMHTTIIRASMTAYSTAVGPSSRLRKFTTRSANLRMIGSFLAGGANGVGDAGECLVGIRAQCRDGGDANHDDEGQHDRVFDGCRAIFTLD